MPNMNLTNQQNLVDIHVSPIDRYIDIYIYIYIHTHTHIELRGDTTGIQQEHTKLYKDTYKVPMPNMNLTNQQNLA